MKDGLKRVSYKENQEACTGETVGDVCNPPMMRKDGEGANNFQITQMWKEVRTSVLSI